MHRRSAEHDEVAAALMAIGDPARGEAIQLDRGSALQHLGIGFPTLRSRVKAGFSFSRSPPAEVLNIWDTLWRTSPYGDVLFAALAYVEPIVKRSQTPPALVWPVVCGWAARIDNWCHSDMLSGIYSRLLEADFEAVYPQLQAWNAAAQSEWSRRLSLTSLIHYSGKNAVFLPPERTLPLVENCIADRRKHVEMAVGWVLRESMRAYPERIARFLDEHAAAMSARAFARAIENLAPQERNRRLAARKAGTAAAGLAGRLR